MMSKGSDSAGDCKAEGSLQSLGPQTKEDLPPETMTAGAAGAQTGGSSMVRLVMLGASSSHPPNCSPLLPLSEHILSLPVWTEWAL